MRWGQLLLWLPYLALLFVGSYNRLTPAFAGLPFFYWYQLLWIPLGSVLLWIAYRSRSRETDGDR